MRANEARVIGECEVGNHLYFPGDLVFEVAGEDVCESCLQSPYMAIPA